MICEICGSTAKNAKRISLEGSEVNVCERCAPHGSLVKDISHSSAMIRKRQTYRREEIVTDIADDYDTLIKQARTQRGWNQQQLGRKINEPESLIKKLEAGKIEPSEKVAKKLETELRIELLIPMQNVIVELQKQQTKELTLGDIVTIKKRK